MTLHRVEAPSGPLSVHDVDGTAMTTCIHGKHAQPAAMSAHYWVWSDDVMPWFKVMHAPHLNLTVPNMCGMPCIFMNFIDLFHKLKHACQWQFTI